MANTLKFKRGLVSTIPTAALGEPLFTTDTFDLYIGNGTTNTRFQKYIASGATTQILRGDGSLYTFPLAISSPSNGQVLKYNGTSWVNDSDSGITGSGSAGQVAYFTGATTQGGSNNLFWDATNSRLGIGLNTPTVAIDVAGASNLSSRARFEKTGTTKVLQFGADRDTSLLPYIGSESNHGFSIITNNTERARFDASGNLGLGVTPSAGSLWRSFEIGAAGASLTGRPSTTEIYLTQNAYHNNSNWIYKVNGTAAYYGLDAGQHRWYYAASGTAGNAISFTEGMRLTANGRLLLGTTTEGTQLLQVNGTSLFSGIMTLSSSSNYVFNIVNTGTSAATLNYTNSSGAFYMGIDSIGGGAVSGTTAYARLIWGQGAYPMLFATNNVERMRIDANGSVGIGTTSLTGYNLRVAKNITGGTIQKIVNQDGTVQSDVTNLAFGFMNSARTAAASFTLSNYYHFYAEQYALGAGSAITNQFGFVADNTLTGATNNYGFYGNIASGTGRWNLYMNGTAANYINGNLLLGSTTDSGEKLQVTGTMKVTGASTFGGNTTLSGSGLMNHQIVSTNGAGFSYLILKNSATNGREFHVGLGGDGVGALQNRFFIFDSTASQTRFTIDSTGAATFSSSVTATSYNATTANIFSVGGTEGMRLTATNRNLHIGTFTSDSGERLQVNGTMKVTGASTFNDTITLTKASAATIIVNTTDTTSTSAFRWWENGVSKALAQYINSAFATTARQNRLEIGGNLLGGLALVSNGDFTNPPFLLANSGAATFSSSVTAGGNLLLTAGTASSIGAINLIRTGTSPVASRLTFGTDGTGYSFAIGKNQSGTVTDLLTILDSGLATFTDDARFKNTKGILFENASATAVGSIKIGLGATSPLEITNGTHTITLATLGTFVSSNLLVGASTIGTSSTNTIAVANGTAPSSSATDIFHLYSADVTAGNAAPHFRTENGAVIKLYQETTAVGNSIISLGGGNAVLDDTTFDGYTLRQIVKALRNQGILA